jgi:LysR family transcriptional regulator, transcriptional activator of the cysJI operon
MQIGTFKIFCDLVETGSFSKAATLSGITQSAVSQQIRALETRFEVTLVERGRRNFALTPEGSVFLEASKEILDVYDHLDDRLQEMRNVVAGDLKIASIYSIGLHELAPILKQFREKFPDVEVHVEYRRSAEVYAAVTQGDVDLGLVAFPAKRKGLQAEVFRTDRMIVICHPNHPLALRKQVKLSELSGERFISFAVDQPTRKVIDKHFRDAGVEVKQVMEFDNIETVKRAVEIENGISIVPSRTVETEVRSGSLVAVTLTEPNLTRPLGILTRRNRARSPAQKEFLKVLMGEND